MSKKLVVTFLSLLFFVHLKAQIDHTQPWMLTGYPALKKLQTLLDEERINNFFSPGNDMKTTIEKNSYQITGSDSTLVYTKKYDQQGRLSAIISQEWNHLFLYDSLHRLVKHLYNYHGAKPEQDSVTYTYDHENNKYTILMHEMNNYCCGADLHHYYIEEKNEQQQIIFTTNEIDHWEYSTGKSERWKYDKDGIIIEKETKFIGKNITNFTHYAHLDAMNIIPYKKPVFQKNTPENKIRHDTARYYYSQNKLVLIQAPDKQEYYTYNAQSDTTSVLQISNYNGDTTLIENIFRDGKLQAKKIKVTNNGLKLYSVEEWNTAGLKVKSEKQRYNSTEIIQNSYNDAGRLIRMLKQKKAADGNTKLIQEDIFTYNKKGQLILSASLLNDSGQITKTWYNYY